MSKTKISYKQFIDALNFIKLIDTKPKDKLSWGAIQLTKYFMQFTSEKYNDAVRKILVETASTDSSGNFYLTEKGEPDLNVLSKENQAIRDQKTADLLNEKIEVETFFVTDYTRVKTLSTYILTALNGMLWSLKDEQIEAFFYEAPEPIKESKTDKAVN